MIDDWLEEDVITCIDDGPLESGNLSKLTNGKTYIIQSIHKSHRYPGEYMIRISNDDYENFGYYSKRFILTNHKKEIYGLEFYKNPNIDYFQITKEIVGG